MIKKDLTLRERRKIYEDAICVVSQTQKIKSSSKALLNERFVKNVTDRQFDHCVSIIAATLGYHETPRINEDGTKQIMLLPEDDNAEYGIYKDKFCEIIQDIPSNRALKEALWKTFIKRDKKAKTKLDAFIIE
jgi:hypothetical protein